MAAVFVWKQIADARDLRRDPSEPDVVAIMEPNANQPQVVEVAIKSFGPTPARDVTVAPDPPLRRTNGEGGIEEVWIPTTIPYMAPGQEWRTTWDFAPQRVASALRDEDRHTVDISYVGLTKTRRRSTAVFDWAAYKGRRYMDQKSVHHAAKALAEMNATLKKWTEGSALRTMARDGDARDKAEREELDQWRAEQSEAERGRAEGETSWHAGGTSPTAS